MRPKAVNVKNTVKGHGTQAHERRKAPEPFAPRPPNQAHEHGRSLSPGSTSLFELFTQQEEKNSKVSLFPRSSQRAPSGTRCFGQAESRDAERVRALHSRRCAWSRCLDAHLQVRTPATWSPSRPQTKNPSESPATSSSKSRLTTVWKYCFMGGPPPLTQYGLRCRT